MRLEKMLQDLRFFIGSFFLIVGLILVAQGMLSPSLVEGYNLNLLTGSGFLVFAVSLLALAWRS